MGEGREGGGSVIDRREKCEGKIFSQNRGLCFVKRRRRGGRRREKGETGAGGEMRSGASV